MLGNEVAGELDGRRVLALSRAAGGYAERVEVDPRLDVHAPDDATFAAGASFLTTYLTAYIPLHHQVRVTPASTVLVHAGSGGVGCAAIQLAKQLGAKVIATASSDEKRAFALEVGADQALGYDELDDLRVDVVIDPVGGEVFTRSLPLLNPLGAIVAVGFAGGLWTDPSVQWLVGRNASVVGIYLGRLMKLQPRFVHDCAIELLALWARRSRSTPSSVSTFPLADAGAAHALIESSEACRQGRARAVKALVTGGEGGLGRAMRARLEREGFEVSSLDLTTGFDVTDPAAWERVEAVDLACLNAGILTAGTDLRTLSYDDYRRGGLGERRRRRARRSPPRTGDGRGDDRRDRVARRSRRDAARCDLFADEARGGGVRPQHRSADRADQDQCDLSRDRRHADARPARSARDVRGGRVSPARAGEVADAMWLAATSNASGECWFVQPGRTPAPFRFPNVPGPRRQGETVGLPPISG